MRQAATTASAIALTRWGEQSVASISALDTLAVLTEVLLPTISKGVIMRRPAVMGIAEWLQFDRRAVRRMQVVHDKYGTGPLLLRMPGRSLALLLDPQHVQLALQNTPEPFATATKEKRAALAHFEPKNVLISSGGERQERREYNEKVLEPDRRVHHLASSFVRIVDEEARRLCMKANERGELNWELFAAAWFRVVRRVVFGTAASGDEELSSLMARLRRDANWAFLSRQRPQVRRRLFERIQLYLQRAEPESLAGAMAHVHAAETVKPEQQVPQWLFAFDPAGMTTFRSLALLCAFPDYARTVRQEIAAKLEDRTFTRAVVLESLRLWPTTPLILRDTTRPTVWETGALPKGTGLVIFTPFFHRNRERLAYADRFTPELWTDGQTAIEPTALVPFSDGPAICPGRNLVLLLTSAMLTSILDHTRLRLLPPRRIDGIHPLPATLNHFKLKFELSS